MNDSIQIYTDGACQGNPGFGGWGVLLKYGTHEKRLSGSEPFTTNNRMEMQAAIEGLSAIKADRSKVIVVTDSMYLRDGVTQWIYGWKKNGWKTKDKKMVKNIDLWQKLDQLLKRHEVTWEWVKGHNGHPENEIVDQLACSAIKTFQKSLGIYEEVLFD